MKRKRWKIHFLVGDKWCYDAVESDEPVEGSVVLEEWWRTVKSEPYHDFVTDSGRSTMRVDSTAIVAAEVHA